MKTYVLRVNNEMRGPYVREQLQKMWDNGIITANSEISHDEDGPWLTSIDFFINKNEPSVTSKSSIPKSSELSVPLQKNVETDCLDSVIRHGKKRDLQKPAASKPTSAELNRRLYGNNTKETVSSVQEGAYSNKNSGLTGFKVFCLRFFSLVGYFALIGALLGYGNSNIAGLVVGWAGGGFKGMFWGLIFGLVSYFKFKKFPNEYSFKKHVYVSAIFGVISVIFILIALLLN